MTLREVLVTVINASLTALPMAALLETARAGAIQLVSDVSAKNLLPSAFRLFVQLKISRRLI